MTVQSLRRLGVALLATWQIQTTTPAADWEIDLGSSTGRIRPLHGVNGGPLCYRGTVDLTARHRELKIPLTRLHDTVWVNADAVDVHAVFPDFRDDPSDPDNYDFRTTDDVVQAVRNSGAEVVYRLGESIEHTARKYRVNPPADSGKWADICIGIIRHYNEGWAGGFRHGIRYWEIWNEPDVRPSMWTGTDEQFLELYEITARRIKARFPNLKIGGPALGSIGEVKDGTLQPSPFLRAFLSRCRDRHVPLDFFSWHRYTAKPGDLVERARAVRSYLDSNGFQGTESHLNEWNYLPGDDWGPMLAQGDGAARKRWYQRMNGAEGAAFAVAALILLQDAPIDVAQYYTGEIQGFGLFTIDGEPKRTFHGFRLFRDLLSTPIRVPLTGTASDTLVACAGHDLGTTTASLLLASTATRTEPIRVRLIHSPWHGSVSWEAEGVTTEADATILGSGQIPDSGGPIEFQLHGPAVVRVTFRPVP